MNRVFLCSPYNSTMFTRCCEVAINDDQARCPVCKEEVHPGEQATPHERNRMRWNMAYKRPSRVAHVATLDC